MTRRVFPLLLAGAVLGAPASSSSSPPAQPDAGRLALALHRLLVVGNVLYVAAHPDDENTRLLAWMAGERGLRTAYLSLTRGEGGQNLVGREQGEVFGLLRTAELMEARRIDGAEQFFTRAIDFGYSKSTDESLRLWGRDEVLADVVRVVRGLQPDVIVTRFSPDDTKTHGHHSASAVLAREAFAAAADGRRFRVQGGGFPPWQARRLLWNKSTWSKAPEEDWSGDLPLDVGSYSPLLGQSWGEIAGRSRSMHRSQGFGAEQQRGSVVEYFEVLAGEAPPAGAAQADAGPGAKTAGGDFLAGIDFSWRRAGGDDALIAVLERAASTFRAEAPHETIPLLLDARRRIRALPDSVHKEHKLVELDAAIAGCAGLWLEATADGAVRAAGEDVEVTATALNRSPFPAELVRVHFAGSRLPEPGGPLPENSAVVRKRTVTIPRSAPDSTPPWLREAPDGARYRLPSPALIGAPSGPAALVASFEVRLGDQVLHFVRAVDFKWVDPVEGERRRALEVHPAVTVTLDRRVLVFPDDSPRRVRVTAKAGAASVSGTLGLEVPRGWRVEPARVAFELAGREAERVVDFRVWPPAGAAARGERGGRLRAVAKAGRREFSQALVRIEHPHVPTQVLFPPAEAALVPVALERGVSRVGYIPGAGDDVGAALAEVGYEVTVLDEEALGGDVLDGLDAVLVGVRAHNVNARLRFHHERLMRWVEGGGTLVVQYNAVNRISDVTGPIGPFPFAISRDRVTDEASPVHFVDAADPVFHQPNRIAPSDFDGWVQERGLYFADAAGRDPRYRAPLALRDPGEDWKDGALLVADHGRGRFVYTGLAFFRQIPAGVPGAYRLLANLLAAGKATRDIAGGGPPSPLPAAAPARPGSGAGRSDDQSSVRN